MRCLIALLALVSLGCVNSKPAAYRIGYFGNNTFHWATCDGLELLSWSPSSSPTIRNNGGFSQEQAKLAVRHEGKIFPEIYEPPLGDFVDVDFSSYAKEGTLLVTRTHCGLPYLSEKLSAYREGLEVLERKLLPTPEAEPEDVLKFGQAYFAQDPTSDLTEAKVRFFRAGVAYPKLALQFLQRIQDQAEQDKALDWTAEAINYRDRFQILEDLSSEKAKE